MAEGGVSVVPDGRRRGEVEAAGPEGDAAPPRPDDRELPLHALLVVAALAAAAFGQGAYYRSGQMLVAALLAAAGVLTARRSPTLRAQRPLVAAGAALAAWSVVSATAAGRPGAAVGTVLVLAGATVVVLACTLLGPAERERMADALVGLGVAVALTGLAGVAWRRPPWALEDQLLWRAATTLTYANVAAGFLAVVALLALAGVAASPRPLPPTLAACVVLTGLGATLSRGGCIALLAGMVALTRLVGTRALLRAAVPPVLGALVALAALSPSIPSSAPARPVLALTGLLVGLAVAAAASRLDRRGLLAIALAGAVGLVALAAGPARDASRRIAGPRATVASSDRVGEARAALEVAAGRPLLGSGPGLAKLSWTRDDGAVLTARYAHNEYLQALAELGAVGLGLLLTLLVLIARGARRSRRAACAPPTWAGGVAGLLALGVHGLFDFGWHLPAIALTGALLVGIVATTEREVQA